MDKTATYEQTGKTKEQLLDALKESLDAAFQAGIPPKDILNALKGQGTSMLRWQELMAAGTYRANNSVGTSFKS